jgi:hypothetical protein
VLHTIKLCSFRQKPDARLNRDPNIASCNTSQKISLDGNQRILHQNPLRLDLSRRMMCMINHGHDSHKVITHSTQLLNE